MSPLRPAPDGRSRACLDVARAERLAVEVREGLLRDLLLREAHLPTRCACRRRLFSREALYCNQAPVLWLPLLPQSTSVEGKVKK